MIDRIIREMDISKEQYNSARYNVSIYLFFIILFIGTACLLPDIHHGARIVFIGLFSFAILYSGIGFYVCSKIVYFNKDKFNK